jgi:hypothetical protein
MQRSGFLWIAKMAPLVSPQWSYSFVTQPIGGLYTLSSFFAFS